MHIFAIVDHIPKKIILIIQIHVNHQIIAMHEILHAWTSPRRHKMAVIYSLDLDLLSGFKLVLFSVLKLFASDMMDYIVHLISRPSVICVNFLSTVLWYKWLHSYDSIQPLNLLIMYLTKLELKGSNDQAMKSWNLQFYGLIP